MPVDLNIPKLNVCVGEFVAVDEKHFTTRDDRDTEFFRKFAAYCLKCGFGAFNLAAGELPLASILLLQWPLADQQFAILAHNRCDNAVCGFSDRHEGMLRGAFPPASSSCSPALLTGVHFMAHSSRW